MVGDKLKFEKFKVGAQALIWFFVGIIFVVIGWFNIDILVFKGHVSSDIFEYSLKGGTAIVSFIPLINFIYKLRKEIKLYELFEEKNRR